MHLKNSPQSEEASLKGHLPCTTVYIHEMSKTDESVGTESRSVVSGVGEGEGRMGNDCFNGVSFPGGDDGNVEESMVIQVIVGL